MYDYTAQNDDELAFNKGQIINVLNKEDPDWWKGEVNGQVGLFPSNYVKLTTDMDPSQQCKCPCLLSYRYCLGSILKRNMQHCCDSAVVCRTQSFATAALASLFEDLL